MILVTGANGFIGSHVLDALIERGFEVKVLHHCSERRTTAIKSDLVDIVYGDIRNPDTYVSVCKDVDSIIHFAALINVDESRNIPRQYWDVNVGGTFNLLEAARQHNISRFTYMSCYDKETRAFTDKGLKYYYELTPSDKVLSLNPLNKMVEWRNIEKIIIQDYKGPMIIFKGKRFDFKVTPNHRMYIETNKRRLFEETAEKCYKRCHFYLPVGIFNGIEKEDFVLNDFSGNEETYLTSDLFYLAGLYIGDGYTNCLIKQVKNISGLNKEDYMKNFRNDKGTFIKSSKIGNLEYNISKCYRVFLCIPKTDKNHMNILNKLNEMGLNAHSEERCIYFTSEIFHKFLKQFGNKATEKFIPSWMLEYSPHYLLFLLKGLMDSDGYKDMQYTTSSKPLINSFIELSQKLGLTITFGKRHRISYIKNRKIESDGYTIGLSKRPRLVRKTSFGSENYKGKIWCVEVKDNHNFLVERGGKLSFSGNTAEQFGNIVPPMADENTPANPSSPYASSKFCAERYCYSYYLTYNLPVSIVIGFNVYGPRQRYGAKGAVIATFIKNALAGKSLRVNGTGEQTRDYTYIKDMADGIVRVHISGRTLGQSVILASGVEYKVVDIAKKIRELVGSDSNIEFGESRPGENMRSCGDAGKALKLLNWKPTTTFEDGLTETIQYYKNLRNEI